jgi:hypothetical protein
MVQKFCSAAEFAQPACNVPRDLTSKHNIPQSLPVVEIKGGHSSKQDKKNSQKPAWDKRQNNYVANVKIPTFPLNFRGHQ